MSWYEILFLIPEGIDKIRDEIFVCCFFLNDFFFVFDNDFIVSNFDNFFSGNGKLGIGKTFDEWAFNNDLLYDKIFCCNSKISYVAELGTFFGFDFEANRVKI